jgi:site-specific recombinase XerD
MEVCFLMDTKRLRWNTMDKNEIPLARLTEQYLTTCRTEGKTASTLRGYTEKLGRFIRWWEDARLADFSVELAREYIAYLQVAP